MRTNLDVPRTDFHLARSVRAIGRFIRSQYDSKFHPLRIRDRRYWDAGLLLNPRRVACILGRNRGDFSDRSDRLNSPVQPAIYRRSFVLFSVTTYYDDN